MIRMLIAVDGSKPAEQAVAHAASFAKSFEAQLHLLRVIEKDDHDPDKQFDGLDWELRCRQCERYLQGLKSSLAAQGIEAQCHVSEGSAPAEIIEFCRKYEINLIVLSAYGEGGVTQFPRGSTVQKVISKSSVSLLLVRPSHTPLDEDVRYKRVMVPLDGSRRSDWAMYLAAAIAQTNGAELCLLQITQQPNVTPGVLASAEGKHLVERLVELSRLDALQHMEEAKSRLPKDLTVKTRVAVASQIPPAVEEAATADDSDLLVLSAHGMTDGGYWLYGPIAETILAHTSRPVLVLQDAPEWNITLKPISGGPARSERVERQQHRAEVS